MQAFNIVKREIHRALAIYSLAAISDNIELQMLLAGEVLVSKMRIKMKDTRIILRRLTPFSQLPLHLLKAVCIHPK